MTATSYMPKLFSIPMAHSTKEGDEGERESKEEREVQRRMHVPRTVLQQIIGIAASVDMYAEYPLTGQDWILVYTSPPLSCSVSKPKLVQHHFVVLYQNLEPRSGFTQKYNRRRGRLPAGLETTQYLWNPLSSNA
ncbi:uncharacterized protein LOC123425730 [Hordeum vulgare subsp. vulgare]|uniref:uncharacterized protein LOC123425730 n=1 Tax=Hordeum vulgare subsp. vulgare TaxID=112509 RepID=UPI001D1A475A|nr:uncharacterized protein LOC123425730 [Hordeum vulgare subsp. vulgare]